MSGIETARGCKMTMLNEVLADSDSETLLYHLGQLAWVEENLITAFQNALDTASNQLPAFAFRYYADRELWPYYGQDMDAKRQDLANALYHAMNALRDIAMMWEGMESKMEKDE